MLKRSHEKIFSQFINKEDEDALNEYIIGKLSKKKVSTEEMKFIDDDFSWHSEISKKNKNLFQVLIEFEWHQTIRLIFEKTSYIPSKISLNCIEFKLRTSIHSAVAFHQYLKELKKSGVFKTNSNIKEFDVKHIDIPFYPLDTYEPVINMYMNKNEDKNKKREYAYEDFFDFIRAYFEKIDKKEVAAIFLAINQKDPKQAKFFLKTPKIFFQDFSLENKSHFLKIFEGLSHFGDEKWVKDNYLLNVFDVNKNEVPFENYQDFVNYFNYRKEEDKKLISFNKSKPESQKKFPKFYNPKEGVIVIEENDTFLIINFLNNRCSVKETKNCISFDTEGKTTGIKTEDFHCNKDFEKFKIFILETIKGRNPEFPEIINGEKPSLSIEHE